MAQVLIVDDEGKMRALLAMALDSEGIEVDEAGSGEDALAKIVSAPPAVLITDIRMNGMTGLELLSRAKKQFPETEIIVMTAFADARTGIDAMRAGAFEYVAKPFEMDHMLLLVRSAMEKRTLRSKVRELAGEAESGYCLDRLIGDSAVLRDVVAQAKLVAPRDTTVLIRGQSGTGKELFARGIHGASGRSPFVAVNCAALAETLLESELFGHEKGAFTGAVERKAGLFETAGNGTLFLDEIGDISAAIQAKLLRVLQEKEFTRVGGTQVLRSSARVLAATNRNLEKAVAEGEFREDLFYRLNVFPLTLPPLRDRRSDIPFLVDRFCLKFHHTAGVSPDALEWLRNADWPGNVRELENCIERTVIIANGSLILPAHLPDTIRNGVSLAAGSTFLLPPEGVNLIEIERSLIVQALERAGGSKTRAAELLGISRRAMYSKMKTHGLDELS